MVEAHNTVKQDRKLCRNIRWDQDKKQNFLSYVPT